MPKVSVVIPSYNSERVVPQTIESILNQTYKDMEVIVVDDGSTDGTRQALEQFGDRIRYIHQQNSKRSAARNTGIRAAMGEYIAFCDSDDLWLPEKAAKQVAILDSDPRIVLVCCPARFIDLDGNPVISRGREGDENPDNNLTTGNWTRLLFMGDVVPGGGSSAMVRRDALLRAGLFDEQIDYGEEWDTWLRLSYRGWFAYIPEALVKFRVSGWERVLHREASNELMSQSLHTLEKASVLWQGNPGELGELLNQAHAVLWLRATLASFQLEMPEQGRNQFSRMLVYSPMWAERRKILDLAIDRAYLISLENDDIESARKFLSTYFANLPEQINSLASLKGEATARLMTRKFQDAMAKKDSSLARRYWSLALNNFPGCMLDRGFQSTSLELWLGAKVTNRLRMFLKRPVKIMN